MLVGRCAFAVSESVAAHFLLQAFNTCHIVVPLFYYCFCLCCLGF